MIRVELPWPTHKSGLSQNSRPGHWSGRHRANKKGEKAAWGAALASGAKRGLCGPEGEIPVRLIFVPPHGARPDDQNAIGACKAYLDGIALALDVNDRRFRLSHVMVPSARPAKVIVEIFVPEVAP